MLTVSSRLSVSRWQDWWPLSYMWLSVRIFSWSNENPKLNELREKERERIVGIGLPEKSRGGNFGMAGSRGANNTANFLHDMCPGKFSWFRANLIPTRDLFFPDIPMQTLRSALDWANSDYLPFLSQWLSLETCNLLIGQAWVMYPSLKSENGGQPYQKHKDIDEKKWYPVRIRMLVQKREWMLAR